MTVVNLPQVLQVDPFPPQEPYSVHQFPDPYTADALVGIVDMDQISFTLSTETLRPLLPSYRDARGCGAERHDCAE